MSCCEHILSMFTTSYTWYYRLLIHTVLFLTWHTSHASFSVLDKKKSQRVSPQHKCKTTFTRLNSFLLAYEFEHCRCYDAEGTAHFIVLKLVNIRTPVSTSALHNPAFPSRGGFRRPPLNLQSMRCVAFLYNIQVCAPSTPSPPPPHLNSWIRPFQ